MSFGLREGHPEFRYDVGSGPAIIRASRPLKLGQWHTVRLMRDRRNGTLTIVNHGGNNESIVRGTVPGGSNPNLQGLDLTGSLYLGSVPSAVGSNIRGGGEGKTLMLMVQQQTGLRTGFVGCISRLVISGRVIKEISPTTGGASDVPESSAIRVCTNVNTSKIASYNTPKRTKEARIFSVFM